MADEKNSREYILQSVDNALRVLDSFNSMEPEMGVSELSRKLGLSKSAIFRIVSTLEPGAVCPCGTSVVTAIIRETSKIMLLIRVFLGMLHLLLIFSTPSVDNPFCLYILHS